ncbi:MAG: CAP domain-containing protein [Thermoleophilaceae bacterium]
MLAPGALLAALLACAPAAEAAPRVLSVDLDRPAVAGRGSTLIVGARDEASPVNTMVVRVGSRALYATSACRAADSGGLAPGAPFAPGSTSRLAAPLHFDRTGTFTGLIRVDSAGCGGSTGNVFQPLTVTPVRPGRRPRPLGLGLPGPVLPGTKRPPGLPLGLPVEADASRRSCPGAHRRVRRSRKARAAASKALVCLINRIRRRYGLRPLRQSRRLRRAAAWHSRSMVRHRYFSHFQPGGLDLVTRLRRVRYLPAHTWLVGENLAAGTGRLSTAAVQVTAWMHSSGHRANLLNRRFRDIGLGVVSGVPSSHTRGGTYTADFGFRR